MELLSLAEIRTDEQNDGAKFYAIGNNGRKYSATYSKKFGGVMYFAIPYDVEILGYKRAYGTLEKLIAEYRQ